MSNRIIPGQMTARIQAIGSPKRTAAIYEKELESDTRLGQSRIAANATMAAAATRAGGGAGDTIISAPSPLAPALPTPPAGGPAVSTLPRNKRKVVPIGTTSTDTGTGSITE